MYKSNNCFHKVNKRNDYNERVISLSKNDNIYVFLKKPPDLKIM